MSRPLSDAADSTPFSNAVLMDRLTWAAESPEAIALPPHPKE